MFLLLLGFGCQKKVKFTAKNLDSSTGCRLEASPIPLERREVKICEFCYLILRFSNEMQIVLVIHRFKMLLHYIFLWLLELNCLEFVFNQLASDAKFRCKSPKNFRVCILQEIKGGCRPKVSFKFHSKRCIPIKEAWIKWLFQRLAEWNVYVFW